MTAIHKLRLTPVILDEVSAAIEDALANQASAATRPADPTDPTYIKIHEAIEAATSTKRGITIDANEDDIRELKSRAEYNVGPGGVCAENLADCYEACERGYWLGRINGYRALLKQIAAIAKAKGE